MMGKSRIDTNRQFIHRLREREREREHSQEQVSRKHKKKLNLRVPEIQTRKPSP